MSNNTVTLVGRVGQPPALKQLPGEKHVLNLSLAVKEYSPTGDDATMWIDVELWNGLAERGAQVITKGRELVITGRLALNTYKKKVGDSTVETTRPIIRASNFHLCGPKPKTADSTESESASTETEAA